MSRPSWERTWLDVAALIARRSLCSRAQVGAVIVDTRNRVVATGYNGSPAGYRHRGFTCTTWCPRAQGGALDPTYDDCPSLHAEANALLAADRSTWQGGTIYVTGCVCMGCAKLVANSGLAAVVYLDDRAERAYRNPAAVDEFFVGCGLSVVRKLVTEETQ